MEGWQRGASVSRGSEAGPSRGDVHTPGEMPDLRTAPGTRTFVTQYGLEGLTEHEVQAASSATTVLFQKRKQMDEFQVTLEKKRSEFEARMRRCRVQEESLKAKQETMKHSVAKFEVFLKENDAKQAAVHKKERVEVKERVVKEREIFQLQQQIVELEAEMAACKRNLSVCMLFRDYLESVLKLANEEGNPYVEIDDVVRRYHALTASNRELQQIKHDTQAQLEKLRAEALRYTNSSQDRVLIKVSEIGVKEKALERARGFRKHTEGEEETNVGHMQDRIRLKAEALLSLGNLYTKVRKPKKPKNPSLEELMEGIEIMYTDMDYIAKVGTVGRGDARGQRHRSLSSAPSSGTMRPSVSGSTL